MTAYGDSFISRVEEKKHCSDIVFKLRRKQLLLQAMEFTQLSEVKFDQTKRNTNGPLEEKVSC